MPTVVLNDYGAGDSNGNYAVRGSCARLLGAGSPIRFYGFIEGDDIGAGTVDVVVTDGFTGNVALKTAEGTVKLAFDFLRSAFKSTLGARLGYWLARHSLRKLRDRLDPRGY